MVPAIMSSTLGVLEGSALWMTIGAACVAVMVAELRFLQRLRASVVLLTWSLGTTVLLLWRWSIIQLDLIPSLIGPTEALWLQMAVGVSGLTALLVLALRLLARASTFCFALETTIISLAVGSAFFPHQYRIVMRPLWFSDFAWSLGVRPADALGLVGMLLGALLILVTVVERSRRLHPSALLLPLVPLLALLLIDPLELESPPPPAELQSIKDGFGDPEKRQSAGAGAVDEQSADSGSQEKSGGGGGEGESKPVAILRLHSDYDPPSEYFYLRQEAYTSLSGYRLSTSTGDLIEKDWFTGFPNVELGVETEESTRALIGRRELSTDVALLASHTTPFGIESPVRYVPTLNPRPGQFDRTYIMQSMVFEESYTRLFGGLVGEVSWSETVWEHLTTTPADERYSELARSIAETLPIHLQELPVAQAFAVKLWLDKKMKYTQRVKHDEAVDPIAEFLFGPVDQYTGYCVHSAHAAVYLWRSLGLPARVAVGYAVSAEQRKGASVMVLDSDAHSWPELYVTDYGWVPIDIAPETNLDQVGEPPDMAMLTLLEELLEAESESDFRPSIDWAALWSLWKPRLQMALFVFLSALLFVLYAWKLSRRLRGRWSGEPRAAYVAALDHLSELGLCRQEGETREAFARRVECPAFLRLTWAFLQQKLDLPGRPGVTINGALDELRHSTSERFPWWRRALGWLNPLSTLRTK